MLKVCLTVIVLLVTNNIIAQIKKGSILLGGQVSGFQVKNDVDGFDKKSEGFTIKASVGKAFRENNVLGLVFGFSPSSQTNLLYFGGDTVNRKLNQYEFGLNYRRYNRLARDFYFFSHIEGAYINSKEKEIFKNSQGNIITKQNGGIVSLTPGVSYQLFKKMQIELAITNLIQLSYLKKKVSSNVSQINSSSESQLLVSSNISNGNTLDFLGIGFRFLL